MSKFNAGDKVVAVRSLKSFSKPGLLCLEEGAYYTVESINNSWVRVLDREGTFRGGWLFTNFAHVLTMEND